MLVSDKYKTTHTDKNIAFFPFHMQDGYSKTAKG